MNFNKLCSRRIEGTLYYEIINNNKYKHWLKMRKWIKVTQAKLKLVYKIQIME